MSKFKKNRSNHKLKKQTIKIQSIQFKGIHPLETAMYYDFCELHRTSLPSRLPIVNKIRALMIERGDETNVYKDLELKGLNEKRIRDSLSSSYCEPVVITELCKYFGISEKTNFHDFIANYDFEQKKDISHKKGRHSDKDKENFLREYKSSWSIETVQAYIDELANYQDQFCYGDDELCKIEDDRKRMTFQKLYRIYEQYPAMVVAFSDMFVE